MKSRHSLQDIRRSFQNLAKKHKDNDILVLMKNVTEKIEGLILETERTHLENKSSATVEQRYVVYSEIPGGNPKITYVPSSGECRVKIPAKSPDEYKQAAKLFAEKIIKEIPDHIKLTLRGTLHWSNSLNNYRVTLQENSRSIKSHKLNF
jgi:hypothetical protein